MCFNHRYQLRLMAGIAGAGAGAEELEGIETTFVVTFYSACTYIHLSLLKAGVTRR